MLETREGGFIYISCVFKTIVACVVMKKLAGEEERRGGREREGERKAAGIL